jgi:enoyl-CoA hydratase/carnithine racemase
VSSQAVAVTKRQLVDDLLGRGPGASVERSKSLIDEMTRTADYREAVAAFRERRPPRF